MIRHVERHRFNKLDSSGDHASSDSYGTNNGRGLAMPDAKPSDRASRAAWWRTAPASAGLAAVILAGATHASADAHRSSDAIFERPFATSPIPFSAGAIVSTTISPPPAAALPGEPVRPDARGRADATRFAGQAWLNRMSRRSQATGLDSWWIMMGGMVLSLAIAGAIGIVARRLSPRTANGAMHVVGCVSLSPKHAVYLLRVGQRVFLLGAGPQGAPALLGELDELPTASPTREDRGEP
jgi:flagellar biogenesis protein FliO